MAPQPMGWQTVWLILKLMLLALSAASAASDSPPCQVIVSASDDGEWSVGGRGQVSCACEGYVQNLTLRLGDNVLATEIVNNTVLYTEPFATESVQDTYECGWTLPVKSAKVTVFPVLNVTDFSCRYDDSPKLNCSFSRADGEDFHQKTRYQVYASGGLGIFECTVEQGKAGRMHCMLSMTSYAHAFPSENFVLNMTITTDRGPRTQIQRIELLGDSMFVPQWPVTKPSRTTVTNNKTCLAWQHANELVEKGRKLEWVVELRPRRPEVPPLNLTLPGAKKTDQMRLTFCFPHPPQGFQVFDVRLKCHLKGKNTIWSEYYPEFAITTNATVPARPPQLMTNGFSFDEDKHELTVLWYPLDEIDHNGPNLTYDVFCNGNQANHTYSRSAIFLNWDDSQPANVTVRSRNSVGASLESSVLRVPAISDVAKRRATHLEYHPHFDDGPTTLSWDKPEDSDLLLGYTIYWCNASTPIGSFCQDVGTTNSITINVDDGERQAYKFNSSMIYQNIALEPNYNDSFSGGMSVLPSVATGEAKAFTLRKVQIMEGIGALLVLGLVVMSVKKLRKMYDIKADLPDFITNQYTERRSAEPKSESKLAPRLGVPRGYYDVQVRTVNIELQTFTEEHPEREKEQEQVLAQTEPESSPYVRMSSRNTIGRNGDIGPPQPRINLDSNGYVLGPPPRITPNVEEYRNPPPPRLNPDNNPNSNGYVTAPPPRSNPNNGYVDPPLPRLIPNSDGYINPSAPQG